MGVQNPQNVSLKWKKRPSDGWLDGNYVPVNPDNSWRVAETFRPAFSFNSIPLHPLPNAGQYAAHKWSDSHMPHQVKISWFGDEAPYRCTILTAPEGATIGGVSKEQTFNKVRVGETDKYEFQLPVHFALFECPVENLIQGQSYSVSIRVESMKGSNVRNFTFTHDDSKSVWFSGDGNDANQGTFSSPKRSFGHGYNLPNANTKVYRYKAGVYMVNNGTPMNDAEFNSTHCKGHIAYEDGVIFDYSEGHMTGGGADITLMGFKTRGGRPDRANVRQIDFNTRVTNFICHDVEALTDVAGTTGGDNPAFVFFPNIDPQYHENITFSDCRMAPGSKSQMFVNFSVRKFAAINCHAPDMNTASHNGAHAFHLKHGFQDCSIQFCSGSGVTNEGLVWVSSQDSANCKNIDVSFCRWEYSPLNTTYNAMRLNGQVSAGQPNAENLYVQRCSFVSPASSINADRNGLTTNPAKISACAWQSPGSVFVQGSGYEFIGNASEKVTDVDDLVQDKKGLIGHKIYSTLVV